MRGDSPFLPDFIRHLDMDIRADQDLQLADDVIHVGVITLCHFGELEPKPYFPLCDLDTYGKCMLRNQA